MPKPPGGAVASHCVPDGFGHHQPETRPSRCDWCVGTGGSAVKHVHDDRAGSCLAALLDGAVKFRRGSQLVTGREHGRALPFRLYAVSFARPFLRRAATMARPARVRMRVRKPCFLARRRLFGWNVILPLATSKLLIMLPGRSWCVPADGYQRWTFARRRQRYTSKKRSPRKPARVWNARTLRNISLRQTLLEYAIFRAGNKSTHGCPRNNTQVITRR